VEKINHSFLKNDTYSYYHAPLHKTFETTAYYIYDTSTSEQYTITDFTTFAPAAATDNVNIFLRLTISDVTYESPTTPQLEVVVYGTNNQLQQIFILDDSWPQDPTVNASQGVTLIIPRNGLDIGAISSVQMTLGWTSPSLTLTINDMLVVQALADGTQTVTSAASASDGVLSPPILLSVSNLPLIIPLYTIRNTVFPN
jgi:hypothetical protein